MKAGTVITCPDCGLPQIKSTKDLPPGGKMKDACWESVGWDMEGIRMGCYSCGSLWSRIHPKTGKTQIHVEGESWTPLERSFQKDGPRKSIITL